MGKDESPIWIYKKDWENWQKLIYRIRNQISEEIIEEMRLEEARQQELIKQQEEELKRKQEQDEEEDES